MLSKFSAKQKPKRRENASNLLEYLTGKRRVVNIPDGAKLLGIIYITTAPFSLSTTFCVVLHISS